MMGTLEKLLEARIKVEFDTLLEIYEIRIKEKGVKPFTENEREEMLALLDEKATQLGTVCDKINELEKTQGKE